MLQMGQLFTERLSGLLKATETSGGVKSWTTNPGRPVAESVLLTFIPPPSPGARYGFCLQGVHSLAGKRQVSKQ